MSWPEFPTCRLLNFCTDGKQSVNSISLKAAGFPSLYLRSFMTTEMHRWCEVELDYYTWTMQFVWFNTVEDRSRFIQRFLYPSRKLWQYDHAYGIQVTLPGNGNEMIPQMQSLGANLSKNVHMFRAEGHGMELDFSDGEFPPKDAAWIAADYDQAMIGKMCGLEVMKTPSIDVIGIDVDKMTSEESKAIRDRRLLSVFGIVLPKAR